jgi:hypothetical protein
MATFQEIGLLDFVRQYKPMHNLVNQLAKVIEWIDEEMCWSLTILMIVSLIVYCLIIDIAVSSQSKVSQWRQTNLWLFVYGTLKHFSFLLFSLTPMETAPKHNIYIYNMTDSIE